MSFSEFNVSGSGTNIIGFSLGSTVVTLIAAKMSTRYRVQSDSLFPLALVSKQLVYRLQRFSKNGDQQSVFKIASLSPLPVEHLFSCIESHMGTRKDVSDLRVSECQNKTKTLNLILFTSLDTPPHSFSFFLSWKDDLGQLSVQFRAIERRLLTKMKDKKPVPLNQLDTLLYATQNEIISTSHKLEKSLKVIFYQFLASLQKSRLLEFVNLIFYLYV